MFEVHSPDKQLQDRVKDWSRQVKHMQIPNGTGLGARRSKRSPVNTRRKYSMETTNHSVIGQVW